MPVLIHQGFRVQSMHQLYYIPVLPIANKDHINNHCIEFHIVLYSAVVL